MFQLCLKNRNLSDWSLCILSLQPKCWYVGNNTAVADAEGHR